MWFSKDEISPKFRACPTSASNGESALQRDIQQGISALTNRHPVPPAGEVIPRHQDTLTPTQSTRMGKKTVTQEV